MGNVESAPRAPSAPSAPPPERYATAFLVAANLVPLVGIVAWGWDATTIVLLYWAENLIAGFYNVLRMATSAAPLGAKVFGIPFFIVHYGMFCTVHGALIVGMFGLEKTLQAGGMDATELFRAVVRLPGMLWPMLALFASHGISFVENHFLRGGWQAADIGMLMMRPYARMIVLHVAIIFGGFVAVAAGAPGWLALVLVGLKTWLDVTTHRRALGGGSLGTLASALSKGETQ
jgi:hypothetical protein